MENQNELVHIWSGQWKAFWRPEAAGYTDKAYEAGVWLRHEAKAMTSHCGPEKKIKLLAIRAADTAAKIIAEQYGGNLVDGLYRVPLSDGLYNVSVTDGDVMILGMVRG